MALTRLSAQLLVVGEGLGGQGRMLALAERAVRLLVEEDHAQVFHPLPPRSWCSGVGTE